MKIKAPVLMSALLLGSLATAANAQGIYLNQNLNGNFVREHHESDWRDAERAREFEGHGARGWHNGWRNDLGWRDRGFGDARGIISMRQSQLNVRIASLRAELNARVATGAMSAFRANALTARLNSLQDRINADAAAGSLSDPNDFNMLQARISGVSASLNGGRFY